MGNETPTQDLQHGHIASNKYGALSEHIFSSLLQLAQVLSTETWCKCYDCTIAVSHCIMAQLHMITETWLVSNMTDAA